MKRQVLFLFALVLFLLASVSARAEAGCLHPGATPAMTPAVATAAPLSLQDASGASRPAWLSSLPLTCCDVCLLDEEGCLNDCKHHPACMAACYGAYSECVRSCGTSC
ncbi:MAG TPA: hypothetical protein VIH93_10050 [Thermoanaerobaculia bacterium]|jgi:hypothetical protein